MIKIKDGIVYLSVQEIAKRLGVTTRTVARWKKLGYVEVFCGNPTKPHAPETAVKYPLPFQRVFPADCHKYLAIDDANRLFLLHGIHPLVFAAPKVYELQELLKELAKGKQKSE
ncbi:MAG: helix-turn-helix domain-containing protein [Patescibacteria group bacterium]